MPEVQSVGAVDYAQYQPSQYPEGAYAEDYNMQPEVYDEKAEEIKAASKSRLGATILTAAVIGGLALWGGHAWGKKSAKSEIDKAKEAVENYDKAKEAVENYDKAKKALEDLDKEADKVIDSRFGGWKYGKEFAEKVKKAFKDLFKKSEEAGDSAKDATDKAADSAKDKAKDAAKELEEHATDSNK